MPSLRNELLTKLPPMRQRLIGAIVSPLRKCRSQDIRGSGWTMGCKWLHEPRYIRLTRFGYTYFKRHYPILNPGSVDDYLGRLGCSCFKITRRKPLREDRQGEYESSLPFHDEP